MNFNIKPGMICWNGMSNKYKKAYFESSPKILSLFEKNQQKLDKIWLREIKREELEEKQWLSWME